MNVKTGKNRERVFNNNGVYELVTGFYPYHNVIKVFDSFNDSLNHAMPRIHTDDGMYNYVSFLIDSPPADIDGNTNLLQWGVDSANSEVYRERAANILEEVITKRSERVVLFNDDDEELEEDWK